MKNVWIIYNTKYGNCEKVCEDLKIQLSNKFDISIGDVKEIKPQDVSNDNPNTLIVGSRIIIGRPDKKVRKFISELGKILTKPIPKAGILYTHCLEWDPNVAKMSKILKDENVADDILSDCLEIKMQKTKGPAEPGQESKFIDFTQKIIKFIEQ